MEDSCVIYDKISHNNPGQRCTADDPNPLTDAKFRTPMQWDNSTNGGFTKSTKPWLPIGDKYQTVNVASQTGVAESHLEIYRSLQKLRKHDAIKKSDLKDFKIAELSEFVFGFKREIKDAKQESIIVLINYGTKNETVKLDKLELYNGPSLMTLKVVGQISRFKVGQQVSLHNDVTLGPYESIVGTYNFGMSTVAVYNMLIVAMVLIAGYFGN